MEVPPYTMKLAQGSMEGNEFWFVRDGEGKLFFMMGNINPTEAQNVLDALNHACHGHDESDCEDGVCPWGESAKEREGAEPERDESRD